MVAGDATSIVLVTRHLRRPLIGGGGGGRIVGVKQHTCGSLTSRIRIAKSRCVFLAHPHPLHIGGGLCVGDHFGVHRMCKGFVGGCEATGGGGIVRLHRSSGTGTGVGGHLADDGVDPATSKRGSDIIVEGLRRRRMCRGGGQRVEGGGGSSRGGISDGGVGRRGSGYVREKTRSRHGTTHRPALSLDTKSIRRRGCGGGGGIGGGGDSGSWGRDWCEGVGWGPREIGLGASLAGEVKDGAEAHEVLHL